MLQMMDHTFINRLYSGMIREVMKEQTPSAEVATFYSNNGQTEEKFRERQDT